MIYRRWVLIPFLTMLGISIIGCRSVPEDDGGGARPVRIAWAPVVGSLPLFIAIDENLFTANGIAVETVEFSNSNDAVNALIADQVDLIPAVSLIPIVNLELQYPGMVRVFSYSRATPDRASDSIIVAADGPIESLADLTGRKIGVFPGTTATNMLRAFLERRDVSIQGTAFVPLTPATQIGALAAGSVDALFAYEPTTTIAAESGQFRILHGSVYASLMDPSPLGGGVISRSFERGEPELARRAITALDDAVLRMRTDDTRARELIPSFVGIEPEIARKTTIVPSGLSTENDLSILQRMVELLHEVDEVPETLNVERLVAP